YTLIWHLLLERAPVPALCWLFPWLFSAVRRRSHCHGIWTVVKTFLDACQVCSGRRALAEIQLVRARKVRAYREPTGLTVTDVDQVFAAAPPAPSQTVETNRERVSRRQVDKFAE